jgi:metal-responsive CopG/Arc/MetJ family transcriptional regulator
MRLFYPLAFWYNPGHTSSMKTAISIPDELFESAERFAQRQGMSRSELYATALRYYLQEHRSEGITERLDEIYSTEAEALDPAITRLQAQSLPKDTW